LILARSICLGWMGHNVAAVLLFLSIVVVAADGTPTVAVPSFVVSGVDSGLAPMLETALEGNLLRSGRFRLLERREMVVILREQAFEASGCVGAACGARMGRLLGVDQIFLGQLAVFDGVWALSVRRVDVATGAVVQDLSAELPGIDSVVAFLESPAILYSEAKIHGAALRFKETLPFGVQVSLGGGGIEGGFPSAGVAPLIAFQLTLVSGRMLYLVGLEASLFGELQRDACTDDACFTSGESWGVNKVRFGLGYDLLRDHRWTLAPILGVVDGSIRLNRGDDAPHARIDVLGGEGSVRVARNWWLLRGEGEDRDVAGAAIYLDVGGRNYLQTGRLVPERTVFACVGFQLLLSFL